MRRIFLTLAMLAICAGMAWSYDEDVEMLADGVSFVVDGPLPATKEKLYIKSDSVITERLMEQFQVPTGVRHVVATSFAGQRFCDMGQAPLFSCIVNAYANHRSIELTPDIVWLAICQGFARYVNSHAEEVRGQLVDHDGKTELAVLTGNYLFSGQADWQGIVDGFATQIGQQTKGDIGPTVMADFSTTGTEERIARGITLMEAVKPYFEYKVYYILCGIPTITLRGTPADWRSVLSRTLRLADYGLGQWVKHLKPILKQFVWASEGRPDRSFWCDMVKRSQVNSLQGGGCSTKKPTKVDGWFLAFFPDEDGQVPSSVPYTTSMPREMVNVAFRYVVTDPTTGEAVSERPMELWAGFIGADVDTLRNAVKPKTGWLVRAVDDDEKQLREWEYQLNEGEGIDLTIDEVPMVLSKLDGISTLTLRFNGPVKLPTWMDGKRIWNLTVEGSMTDEEEQLIRQRFPKAVVKRRLQEKEQ